MNLTIITYNLRGFAKKSRRHWMNGWRRTTTKSAGLGILISPEFSARVKPWQQSSWISRVMVVKLDDWLIVNLYAPAQIKTKINSSRT
ncbi:Hypothetical protein PHPALM_19740 [Phytophthora palmivora]|uniref:Uncharacterized protein n=1 Tax=Phytophthora palmivora TaxID=4796 RepID=A0A2P4XGM5_9STRA|nr:Hypothetical protein PHPALM_19740 [Phytophthora palmivora]